MSLYLLSLIAGILTVLAPCVLPILPVIIWWSVIDGKKSRPRLIILSFAISMIVFTLILQWLVSRFGVSQKSLIAISAWILILFGLVLLFPQIWNKIMHVTGIESATNKAQWSTSVGTKWDILLWLVLWPVFNGCSPTYALLVSNILQAGDDMVAGLIHLLLYVFWFSMVLLAIAYGGRKVVSKLKRASDPNGWFKKIIAGILIFLWLAILMWRDKSAEKRLIQQWLFIDTTDREVEMLDEVLDDS